jgi:hypothetical protein
MPVSQPAYAAIPEELKRVAQEYADLFNASRLEDVDRLIADACVDPFWDDRTNLLSLLAEGPEELGLVLSSEPDAFVVVRNVGHWVVDCTPIDWDELEDRAFEPGLDDIDSQG